MTEIEATCYFCPSECSLILTVDDQGIVEKVRRKGKPPRIGLSQATKPRCENIVKLRGMHLEKAKAILRSPRVPHIVVGGH